MEANNAALQVCGLRKSYDQLHVLKGVDFDVAPEASSRCSAPTAPARPRS